MCMTTFLNPAEFLAPTSDLTINRLLTELIKETGKDWRVCEDKQPTRRWFGLRAGEPRKLYGLFVGLGGVEFQCINFDLCTEWSINNMVPAVVMVNFLQGYLSGLHGAKVALAVSGLAGQTSPDHPLQVMLGYMVGEKAPCSVPS